MQIVTRLKLLILVLELAWILQDSPVVQVILLLEALAAVLATDKLHRVEECLTGQIFLPVVVELELDQEQQVFLEELALRLLEVLQLVEIRLL